MKKTIVLIVLLLGLGGGAYFLSQKNNTKSSYDLSSSEFKVSDKNSITKVFLAYKNKPTVTLEKKNGVWMYNDKYVANTNVMKNVLEVFTRSKVAYIPPKQEVKNIYKDIGLVGIKVEVYNKDKKLKSYYIGGTNQDDSATYFLMEGEKQPYAMKLPGTNGSLRNRLVSTEEEWRDRTIFGEKQEEIESISVVYPKQKTISFNIINDKNGYIIEPFYKTTKKLNLPLSKPNIDNFFVAINEKMAESIIEEHPKRDSLETLVPFCEINIKKRDGTVHQIKFIPYTARPTVGFNSVKTARYLTLINNGDLMLTQHRVVKAFFRSYDYFFKERK